MNVHVAETLQLLVAIVGAVSALGVILRYKLRSRELSARSTSQADATVDALRAEMRDLGAQHADQLNELYERLEFTERMLARGRAQDGSVQGGGE